MTPLEEIPMSIKTPEQYNGEPRCFICGMSPGHVYFPNCAYVRADGFRYSHEETCDVYGATRNRKYAFDWLCPRCRKEEDSHDPV